MAATRKTHSPDFEVKLVVEALKEQRTVQEIAAKRDLNPNLLFKWRKEFLDHLERVFDMNRRGNEAKRERTEVEAKKNEMPRKIGTFTLECDYLLRSRKKFGAEGISRKRRCEFLGVPCAGSYRGHLKQVATGAINSSEYLRVSAPRILGDAGGTEGQYLRF